MFYHPGRSIIGSFAAISLCRDHPSSKGGDFGATMTLKEILASYDPTAPLDQASTIPASWYLNSELAELERRTVFSHSWQLVGRVEQVEAPGQYITCEIAGEPIVVVRDTDNVLHGFFNVCRHHAAAVMTQPAGTATQLTCPYHGWTYTLDGQLKSAPDLGAVCNFDREAMGLWPIELAVWHQWIFARLDRESVPALPQLADLDLTRFHWFE